MSRAIGNALEIGFYSLAVGADKKKEKEMLGKEEMNKSLQQAENRKQKTDCVA